ncbi:MAG: HAMP domain-containing protein, partial [Comamonadaceae bacterium]
MRRQLEAIQKVYPEFAHLSVVDIAGARVVAATGGIFEGGDASGRPVFEEGRKGLFVADVHDAVRLANLLPRPASGEPLRFLDVAAPVLGPDGRPTRVLGAHLSWQWTSALQQRVLAPVEARRGVQILLVDTHGAVVLPPDAAIAVGTPLQRVLGPAGADPRAAWADGTEYLRAEAPTFATGSFPGLGWRVVVRQPMAVVLAQSDRLRNLLLAGGLGLGLLAAGLGWLIAGRLARPVSQLARAASELALGTNLQSASEEELHEVAVVREAFQRVTGEALARAERLLRELDATYEGAPVGLCVVGVDLRYVRANRVWSDAFVAAGRTVAGTALHDGPLPELEQAIAAALQTGDAQALELEGDRQDPHRIWQTQLAPLRGADGAVVGVSVVATDVTLLRQAERALRQADDRKTQFISMLAHELRNPLAPVINAME